MTPAEKIHAAIEKLEALRTPTDWEQSQFDYRWIVQGRTGDDDALIIFDLAGGTRADAELIVTLHRTIDAQLRILRNVLERYAKIGLPDEWEPKAPLAVAVVALASAILGEDS